MAQNHQTCHCCGYVHGRHERCGHIVLYSESETRHCAVPADWENHPELKQIKDYERRQFREQKLTQWLETQLPRKFESFAHYIQRCYPTAALQLKQSHKMHLGDEYPHALDKYVFRLFMGARMRQHIQGVRWGVDKEELVLQLLREECQELVRDGYLKLDPEVFNSPSTSPWPEAEDMAKYEASYVPPQLDTITRMDSR